MKRLFYTILLLLILTDISTAQNITGTWQGKTADNEYLEIDVVQIGNKACGYTWDYELKNKKSFCKAYFNGDYDKAMRTWFLEGYSFMENSGDHVLMQLKFKLVKEDGEMKMNGWCKIKPNFFSDGGDPTFFILKKISGSTTVITQTMKECIAELQPPKKLKIKKSVPVSKNIPVAPKPSVKKDSNNKPAPVIQKIKDTVVTKPPAVIVNSLPAKINGRINKELSRIVINDKKITLNIYDNGTIDGDTVSIYYNGKQIVQKKGLTANALVVDVILDENVNLHSIVLFAENLGSIPPNTALVVFTKESGKRYQLFSSATLQQNAEIIFEYKPK